MSFVEKLKMEKSDAIVLHRGISDEGQKFFAIIVCDYNQKKMIQTDYEEQTQRELKEYGDIIYFAWKKEPEQEDLDKINEIVQEKYDMTLDIEVFE